MAIDASKPIAPDIMGWQPPSWEDFLGNRRIIAFFQKLVPQFRGGGANGLTNLRLILTGESRSGKTALVKFFVRCLLCEQFNPQTLNPCARTCRPCSPGCRSEVNGDAGLFSYISGEPGRKVPVHYFPIDCGRLETPKDLQSKIAEVRQEWDGLQIVYLDEVHRLVARHMDEMLLKTIEEYKAVWIFSTAKPEKLEDMFLKRLLPFKTELPTDIEMIEWIVKRCDEWKVPWEKDGVLRAVEKSNRVTGFVLQALSLARIFGGLTLDLVENIWSLKLAE